MREPDWISADGRHRMYCGDCLGLLDEIAADTVVTDPPYGIKLKNNCRNGQTPKRKERSFRVEGDDSADATLALLAWCERNQLPTIAFASPWHPWPGDWRNLIAWDKGGAMGGGGDIRTCLKRTWELIQTARTGPMNGNRDVSVWRHTMTGLDTALHICAKPVDLMQRLLNRFTPTDAVVLDPFMGSGTTGVACVATGRHFIGIEKDPAHFATAVRRIEAALRDRAELLIA